MCLVMTTRRRGHWHRIAAPANATKKDCLMTQKPGEPFRLEEATIDDLHQAIRRRHDDLRRRGPTLYRPGPRLQRRQQHAGDRRRRAGAGAPGVVRAGSADALSHRDGESLGDPAGSGQVHGPAAGIRTHGADGVRSVGAATIRHDRRHSQRRPGQCARHAQHPRRAVGHLPRRLRSPSRRTDRCRRARRRSAKCSASSPTRWNARPNWTPRMGRNPDLAKRCRCTASCSPSRTRSIPRTCAPPAAATPPTTSIFPRATMSWSSNCAPRARSFSPRRSTPNTTAGPATRAGATTRTKVLPSTLGYQRSTWAGNPSNPYDTTRAASLGSSSGSALSVSTNMVMAAWARKPEPPAAARPITIRSR